MLKLKFEILENQGLKKGAEAAHEALHEALKSSNQSVAMDVITHMLELKINRLDNLIESCSMPVMQDVTTAIERQSRHQFNETVCVNAIGMCAC